MLEIILILGVIFIILTFFYKQAVCEFRLNQIEWTQRDTLRTVLSEKIPLVLRGIPTATFWTHDDVMSRPCFQDLSIFQEMTLVEWLSQANSSSVCPWKDAQAEKIASVSGMAIWSKKWMEPALFSSFLKFWMTPRYHCWTGTVGLRKTFATWTCLFPVDGEILVSILPETAESSLPADWIGRVPTEITAKDTPFLQDLKYIDIVLRPGNALFMPPHWFVSWRALDTKSICPMTCTLSYHTPISLLAYHASPFTT